jgi:hypothetical protein
MVVYVIDFLNVFSDYRELKYKIMGVDFHKVKYTTLQEDTVEFFNFFFTKYTTRQKLCISSSFIFVMKKLVNYDVVLRGILEDLKHIDIKFVVVTNRYKNKVIDDNKDDFMCQYFLSMYGSSSYLISNDLYRNKGEYLNMFLHLERIETEIMTSKHVNNTIFLIDQQVIKNIANLSTTNCSLSKKKLLQVIRIH